jgi:hypothetical protein
MLLSWVLTPSGVGTPPSAASRMAAAALTTASWYMIA